MLLSHSQSLVHRILNWEKKGVSAPISESIQNQPKLEIGARNVIPRLD